jgi:hypothetical protein
VTDSRVDFHARLSTPGDPICAPDWLALREPADAVARATELLDELRGRELRTVRDLGCGTGSMGRWLRPSLPTGTWYLHERDATVLAIAARDGGIPVPGDLGETSSFGGTDLVTCSALLDLLTAPEIDRLAELCVDAGASALFTLSVTGGAILEPAEPLDVDYAAAFDAHQRRGDLLGPDAARYAVEAFRARGYRVETAASPWRLTQGPLLEEWLRGWLSAACEQDRALAAEAAPYLHRRLADATLTAEVPHLDLLALP